MLLTILAILVCLAALGVFGEVLGEVLVLALLVQTVAALI